MKKFIHDLLLRGYAYDIINTYVKYKFSLRHLVYDNKVYKDPCNTKFIVSEADSLDPLLDKFVKSVSKHYNLDQFMLLKTSIISLMK
ncbi:MAG: hypothetical protein ACRCZ9_00675 [Fusobacteriaceae bacterium]